MSQKDGYVRWSIPVEDLIMGLINKGKTGATMSLALEARQAQKLR